MLVQGLQIHRGKMHFSPGLNHPDIELIVTHQGIFNQGGILGDGDALNIGDRWRFHCRKGGYWTHLLPIAAPPITPQTPAPSPVQKFLKHHRVYSGQLKLVVKFGRNWIGYPRGRLFAHRPILPAGIRGLQSLRAKMSQQVLIG